MILRQWYNSLFDDRDKKNVLSNFMSLSVLQAANYLLPLITLPYLVRVLGVEKFGLIAFANAFIQYFMVLTDYGFTLSATREVSVNRENSSKIDEIFSSVMILKLLLTSLGLIVFLAIVFSFDRFRGDWQVFLLTYGVVVGQCFFPIWFYQGMERMKYITCLNVIAKLIFAASIFIFVHRASDYILVPLLHSLGFLVAGISGFLIAVLKFRVRLYLPGYLALIRHFRASTQFFLSRASYSIYTASNAFFLGLFAGNQMVGFYTMAEKLFMALSQLYHPMVQALYPYVSSKRNIDFYKKLFKTVNAINVLICVVVFLLATVIIRVVYGAGNEISVPVFRILIATAIIVVPSTLMGYPLLAALGQAKYANGSVISGACVHLTGLVVFVILGKVNLYTVSAMVLITELTVFTIRVYAVNRFKLWNEAAGVVASQGD